MPNCPSCKKSLEGLRYFRTLVEHGVFTVEAGFSNMDSDSPGQEELTKEEYACPYCGKVVADSENKAEEFLRAAL